MKVMYIVNEVKPMVVEFNVKKILSVIDVVPSLKAYMEKVCATIANHILADFDSTQLERIIVTDNFVSDVLQFQRANLDGVEGVTCNEYGKAYGKMIFVPKQKRYYIFLDAEYATFLIDDTLMGSIISSVGDELKEDILKGRNCAINLLAHELEHFKFACSFTKPTTEKNLESEYISFIFQLFDEYYVTRKSLKYSPVPIFPYDEDYMAKIEEHIVANRFKYNMGEISLDEFVPLFHQYTNQALMNIAANIALKHETGNDMVLFENCLCSNLLQELEDSFKSLFDLSENGTQPDISQELINWINEYFSLFRVYITETPQGYRYRIPC